ncbi:MAG: 2-isopropylmalate synthase [Melioribacteraceae bacterium]|nr:2-isopropylmalate synthase [Melioribacteraceae bacterium]
MKILDSTLREGEQTPGVYFDSHIKLAIAELLDEIGIDIIETGHPAVTDEIYSTVKMLAGKQFKSVIGAHARSVRKDIELALDCGVGFLGIFYCVSDERLNGVFKKDLQDAIEKIVTSIEFAKKENPGLLIRYTPEDTVRSEYKNVITAAVAAVEAGADIISIADTTGFMVPGTSKNMYDYVTRLKEDFDKRSLNPLIAVHCHNDRGLALANALDALRGGANIIDASVLGLGERAGIVDLAQLLAVLTLEYNITGWKLDKLSDLYNLVSTHSGVPVPVNSPIVGKNAFTHCAGVHTHAAAINPMHYESINPELFGKERHFALDHMSGIASVRFALKQVGISDLEPETELLVLERIKSIGQRGRIVELSELPHIVETSKHYKRIIK